MNTPVSAPTHAPLSEPAYVLLLKCAYGHHLPGQHLPSSVALAETLRIPQQAAAVALDELAKCAVLASGRGGGYLVRPQAEWRTRVLRPTPGARAVLARLIRVLESAQWQAGTALGPDKQLATEYGVHVGDLRWALRLLAMRGIIALPPGRPPAVIRRLPVRRVITLFSGP